MTDTDRDPLEAMGAEPDLQSALLQHLAAQESIDPTMQSLLARAITERAQNGGRNHAESEEDPDRVARRRRAMRTLRDRFEEMEDELDELRDRNDTLAAALGACAQCWGEDPGCELCAGGGGPGGYPPDPQLFDRLVRPGLRRLHATRRSQSDLPQPGQPTTGRSTQ
jgi:hypothetical protein